MEEQLSELSFREGDHVVYFPTGAETNPTSGVIKKIIHERQQVGSQVVQASEDMPRYVIANDKTHKETAYKLENIIEKVEEGGYGEEIEETGEAGGVEAEEGEDVGADITGTGELEEGDGIYDPASENIGPEPEEEYEEPEAEEYVEYEGNPVPDTEIEPEEEDEKEFIREASDIGSYVRIS